FQSAREKPSGSWLSRSVRMRFRDERPVTSSRAEWRSRSCSSVRTRSIGLLREAEDAFGDDVELDLGRAALDRVAARAQPVARHLELVCLEAWAFPAAALRTADRDHE